MKTKQIIIAFMAAILLPLGSLKAQNALAPMVMPLDEVSVSIYGPAVASMPFSGDADWKLDMGYAIGLGADYTHWFKTNMGITTGLKFTYLSTRQQATNFSTDFVGPLLITNNNGSALASNGTTKVRLGGTTATAKELRTMSFVEIPILFSMTFDNIYCNLGLSLNVAMSNYSEYTFNGTSYVIRELPDMGINMPDVPVSLKESSTDTLFQNTEAGWPFYVLLSAEAGYKFHLDNYNAISLGLYGRYAIVNNSAKSGNEPFNLANNRVTMLQPSSTAMVEKMGYYEFGLRIAYHYGVGEKRVLPPTR